MRIILASSSKNRSDLFHKMGIAFEIREPNYEEHIIPEKSPIDQIQEFALGKAQSVLQEILKQVQDDDQDFVILGFDSMISFEGTSIGKPKTKKSAFEMLQKFLGKSQEIMTGVAMIGKWKGVYFEEVFYESTAVKFRDDITNCQIRKYLEFGDWKGKCGAYSILGTGIYFLENIEGDFQNIIGVPVLKIGENLRKITGKSPFTLFTPSE